jgi:hypothetical protein
MSWKLSIEFGGLCMFVQRKSSDYRTGLFVLMPVMPGSMKHEPVMEFGEGNSRIRVPLEGFEVDLTTLATHGSTASKLDGMGNASGYAGRSVEEKFLSGDFAECLAARIVLPYGSKIDKTGKPSGKMKVDKPGAPQETLFGKVQVDVDVEDDLLHRIPIAGATLFRGKNEPKVSIRMVNVTPDDLDNPQTKPHKKGEEVHHFSAYYRLLQDKCPDGGGPRLLVDCDANSTGDCDDTFTGPKIFFVDPYNCTIGSGCQPGTINC